MTYVLKEINLINYYKKCINKAQGSCSGKICQIKPNFSGLGTAQTRLPVSKAIAAVYFVKFKKFGWQTNMPIYIDMHQNNSYIA